MLALLILNLERGGKYTPFSQRELLKCHRTHLVWSFSWNMEFSFFIFTLSWWVTVISNAKKCVCVGEVTGVRDSDQWRLILSPRVCVCVVSEEWATSTARCLLFYQSTVDSLSLRFREGLYLCGTDTLLSLHGERRKASVLHTCCSVCSNILQAVRLNTRRMWTSPLLNVEYVLVLLRIYLYQTFCSSSAIWCSCIHFLYLLLERIKPGSCNISRFAKSVFQT